MALGRGRSRARVPALRIHVADRVAPPAHVLPEAIGVGASGRMPLTPTIAIGWSCSPLIGPPSRRVAAPVAPSLTLSRRGGRRSRPCRRAGRPAPPGSPAGRGARRARGAPPSAPVTRRMPSAAVLSAASRALTRLMAPSAAAPKRRAALARAFLGGRAARRASAPAPSTCAARAPSRRSTCWLRVRRAVRQASISSASAWVASAAAPAPESGWPAARPPAPGPPRGSGRRGLQVGLPAVAGDRHLHDLGGALVDRGDADVALDLLDHVLVGVAVAAGAWIAASAASPASSLPGTWRSRLDVERALAGVDPLGGLLDRGARRLEPHRVGDDQLVGVARFSESGEPAWIRSAE